MVKNGGWAVLWAGFCVAVIGVLVTIIYDWMPTSSRIVLAATCAVIASLSGWRAWQLWKGDDTASPATDVSVQPSPPVLSDPTDSDAKELAILQMFTEFRGKHTVDDVAKRMGMNRHIADYHLDRLGDKHLITHSWDEYRNGKPVLVITRDGRDFLIRLNLIK